MSDSYEEFFLVWYFEPFLAFFASAVIGLRCCIYHFFGINMSFFLKAVHCCLYTRSRGSTVWRLDPKGNCLFQDSSSVISI